jgi:hypothetical protein
MRRGGIRVVTKQEGQKQESPHEAGFLLIHSYQKKTVNRYLVATQGLEPRTPAL